MLFHCSLSRPTPIDSVHRQFSWTRSFFLFACILFSSKTFDYLLRRRRLR
jgi:hypothetical protein